MTNRFISRQKSFIAIPEDDIQPSAFPKSATWKTLAGNVNWLAGQGGQTVPVFLFENQYDSNSSAQFLLDHGKFVSTASFEIGFWTNPNIHSYHIESEIETLNNNIHLVRLGVSGSQWEVNTGSFERIDGSDYHILELDVHRSQSNLAMTSSLFMILPVTYSVVGESGNDARINSISVRGNSRGIIDVDDLGSNDWPALDVGTLGPRTYLFAESLSATSNNNLPRKNVLGVAYGTSASIDYGVRQSFFDWTTPWRITGSMQSGTVGLPWRWFTNSTTAVSFSNQEQSIFPSNVFHDQTYANINYAVFAYSTGGDATTTGSLQIRTSLGLSPNIDLPIGTNTNGQWFTGSFAGARVTMTGSSYLPIGNTLCEKMQMWISRSSGGGSVFVGGIHLSEGPGVPVTPVPSTQSGSVLWLKPETYLQGLEWWIDQVSGQTVTPETGSIVKQISNIAPNAWGLRTDGFTWAFVDASSVFPGDETKLVVCTAFRFDNTTDSMVMIELGENTEAAPGFSLHLNSTLAGAGYFSAQIFGGADYTEQAADITLEANRTYVVSVGFDSTQNGAAAISFIRINGVEKSLIDHANGSTADVLPAGSNLWFFGRHDGYVKPLKGALGNVVIYQGIDQDETLEKVERYIGARAGVFWGY